jgi:GNAT superfamily N-acetyltransferase
VEIREIDPRDETLVHRHWEIGKAAEAATRPFDFYVPWKSAWLTISEGREDLDMVLLGAFEADVMWGAARVDLPRLDNLHSASAVYYVHPDRQRRGVGRALAEASYDVARQRGRRVITTDAFAPVGGSSAGLMFAKAMGFTPALEDNMKVVDLFETESLWSLLAEKAAPRHQDYRIVTWQDRVPDEYLPGYCRLNEMFFDEAPMGELEVEPERWDVDRVRSRDERNARHGRRDLSAGAVAPDGSLVALTEIAVSEHAPNRGFQSGTLVDPAHRGHALGVAIKVANHRQLRDHLPECRVLLTGNADVNAPMNAVNESLGYREVERCVELQRDL